MMNTNSDNRKERILEILIAIALGGVLVAFTMNSLLFTGYNADDSEVIMFKKDNILLNIAGVLLIAVVYYGISRLFELAANKIGMYWIVGATMLISLLGGIYWVHNVHAIPGGDGFAICMCAMQLNDDADAVKSAFQAGGYMAIHPHQYGLLTIVRLMYFLFGQDNWTSLQYLNAAMFPLIVLALYGIAHELTDNRRVEILTILAALLFAPFYMYTSHVYNDTLSLAFMLLSIWNVLAFIRNEKISRGILTVVFMAIASFIRKNALICMIAIVIVLVVLGLTRKKKINMWLCAAMVIVCLLCPKVIRLFYSNVADMSADAIPASLYVAMGMQDNDFGAGVYNGYNINTMLDTGNLGYRANRIALRYTLNRGIYFISHPGKMLDFYTRKVNLQWNVPMFQGLALTANFKEAPQGLAAEMYSDTGFRHAVELYTEWFHLFVMALALVHVITLVKSHAGLDKYIIAVAVYGGFLFSVLWEAKARYVLPYFVMLIPYAMAGISCAYDKMENTVAKLMHRQVT